MEPGWCMIVLHGTDTHCCSQSKGVYQARKRPNRITCESIREIQDLGSPRNGEDTRSLISHYPEAVCVIVLNSGGPVPKKEHVSRVPCWLLRGESSIKVVVWTGTWFMLERGKEGKNGHLAGQGLAGQHIGKDRRFRRCDIGFRSMMCSRVHPCALLSSCSPLQRRHRHTVSQNQ